MDEPPPATDRVARLRAADRQAWEELYTSVQPAMLAYARRRLPPQDAEDAVGEAISRAVAGAERMPAAGSGPEAWLFGILRHVIVDVQRRAYRGRRVLARHRLALLPDGAGEPEVGLLDSEVAAVRAAFSRLAPREQEVLELRVLAGLDAQAVGAIVGLRPGAVRTVQHRALARLRAGLVPGTDDPGPASRETGPASAAVRHEVGEQ